MMELYFQWKFIKDMIGLVILAILILLLVGIPAFLWGCDKLDDWRRKRKKAKP